MKIIQKAIGFVARKINSLAQAQGTGFAEGSVTGGMPELVRAAAAEGAVLLKNNGVLPFDKNEKISLFGRIQVNTFFVGYGSGGDVSAPYKVSYLEGIKSCNDIKLNTALADIYTNWCEKNPVFDSVWGMWPRFLPEMPLGRSIRSFDGEYFFIKSAAIPNTSNKSTTITAIMIGFF